METQDTHTPVYASQLQLGQCPSGVIGQRQFPHLQDSWAFPIQRRRIVPLAPKSHPIVHDLNYMPSPNPFNTLEISQGYREAYQGHNSTSSSPTLPRKDSCFSSPVMCTSRPNESNDKWQWRATSSTISVQSLFPLAEVNSSSAAQSSNPEPSQLHQYGRVARQE